MSNFFETKYGARLAYNVVTGNGLPGIVFLGGFRSDMTGTKAMFLEGFARETGRSFLRFDYRGHGLSTASFEDGCIGDWAQDAQAIVEGLTVGPQILVGSSMGGWIALLLAKVMPGRLAGIVGVAAAPDFLEDSIWAQLTALQRAQVMTVGKLALATPEPERPLILTRRLFEDGRAQMVLREPLDLPFPVRLLQGTADEEVALAVPLRLIDHANCPDMRLTLVKGADHRFSAPENLMMIRKAIHSVTKAGRNG